MRKYGFDNGNGTSLDYGLHFLSFPAISYGSEVLENKTIPGRRGTLTIKTGKWTDTTIENDVEFQCASLTEYDEKMRDIRQWVKNTKKLSYTDMEDCFFEVKSAYINEESRLYGVFGNITITFTCKPFLYFESGIVETSLPENGILYNAHSEAHPLYKITGEGMCQVSVNGKTMTANIGQNLTIDTELMIAYREDGGLQNTSIIGDYSDLFLAPGDNQITVTNGFDLKIIPRWGYAHD